LAETLSHTSHAEEAMEAVHEGLVVSNRNADRYYDAELWRLKGELLRMEGKTADAECSLQKAIEIARQQAAKSLELRASTSLARLWQGQGKYKEAQQMLAEVHSWFTEGFDTADLKKAASLLGKPS
jgi:predicted ATPase